MVYANDITSSASLGIKHGTLLLTYTMQLHFLTTNQDQDFQVENSIVFYPEHRRIKRISLRCERIEHRKKKKSNQKSPKEIYRHVSRYPLIEKVNLEARKSGEKQTSRSITGQLIGRRRTPPGAGGREIERGGKDKGKPR